MAFVTSAGEACTGPNLLGWALGRVFRLATAAEGTAFRPDKRLAAAG